MLIALAGLPGSGKSAVAQDLSQALNCAVLSVDPAEAAMWRAGVSKSEPTGLAAYMVVEALAAEQIALGRDVIVDAVNASMSQAGTTFNGGGRSSQPGAMAG